VARERDEERKGSGGESEARGAECAAAVETTREATDPEGREARRTVVTKRGQNHARNDGNTGLQRRHQDTHRLALCAHHRRRERLGAPASARAQRLSHLELAGVHGEAKVVGDATNRAADRRRVGGA
jgi:hypothetical protein